MVESNSGHRGSDNTVSNQSMPEKLETTTLFKGRKELQIYHDGVCYTLRITSNNKLILTK